MDSRSVQLKAGFDWQGHRGCRGLLPENTIPAFLKALEYPVKTLELDLAISKDRQVIISHEPWFSSKICSKPNGQAISEEEEQGFLIYHMTYDEIKKFDCGSRGNPRFKEQQRMKVHKPSLRDMVLEVEAHCQKNGLPKPNYNIEIKSNPEGYGTHIPHPEEYVRIVLDTIQALGIKERINLQSFDLNILKEIKRQDKSVVVAFLIENTNSIDENIEALGYIPDIYSSYYKLLDKEKINKLQHMGMKVIPWTVNSVPDMQTLIRQGVDGIITDYPDRIKQAAAPFQRSNG